MPRATFTRILDHNSDAAYRVWASDLSAALKACLTQTSDTGQVDWSTGTQVRPGTNTYTHYEVYRFSDALQTGGRPVFIKVEYGTASIATNPSVRITIANSTNGAGVMTGRVYVNVLASSPTTPSAGPVTSWVCYKDGYFGFLLWAVPSPSIGFPHFGFAFERSRDTAGASTANGFYWIMHNATSGNGSAAAYSNDLDAAIAVHGAGNSMVSPYTSFTSTQAKTKFFPHRLFTPDEYAITGALNYLTTEVTPYTEFDVAPLPGVASQHYVAAGGMWFANNALASPSWMTAFRWEV